jgi:hypothetical protein
MKKLTYLLALMFAMVLMNSCSKSPKTLVSSGEWVLSNADKIDNSETDGSLIVKDSTIVLLKENETYNIKWIDKTSYEQDFNGNTCIVKMRILNDNTIEVAFLFKAEKIPSTDEDWEKLKDENKVSYLIRKESKSKEKSYKEYKVGDMSIPVDKVPPAGLYICRQTSAVINVIIDNGNVKFQTGENRNNLVDVNAELIYEGLVPPYISAINFANDFGSCEYAGNGVIENSGSYFNGNSGRTIQFVQETSSNNSEDESDKLLSDEIGVFQNGKANIEYDEYKNLLDRQYAKYSSKFQNLIFEIDYKHILTSDEYSYPFDLMVVIFKIYPNKTIYNTYGTENRLTSLGGVVFEKRYGTWVLINKNFRVVPINPEAWHRRVFQQNPEINKSDGTVEFKFYEDYTLAIGSFSFEYITYYVAPYLDEVTTNKVLDYE